MGACLAAGKDRRVRRLNSYRPELRLPFLDDLGHAGDRAARPHPSHQDVHLTIGIAPYLLGGGLTVDHGVSGVLELLWHEGAGMAGDDLLGFPHGACHSLRPGGEDKLRPENGEKLSSLDGHGVGHGEDESVALGGADEGEGYAGVAAGRLDDQRILGDTAILLGRLDHGDADPVLNAAAGIEGLQLCHHRGLQPRGHLVQSDERGIADELRDIIGDLSHS